MENIKRLEEKCPWCNRKTLGQDETGFKCCVKCQYNSNQKRKISLNEELDRVMAIYDELVCRESNSNTRFTCVCDKLKGHKGEHKDSEHPEFGWI